MPLYGEASNHRYIWFFYSFIKYSSRNDFWSLVHCIVSVFYQCCSYRRTWYFSPSKSRTLKKVFTEGDSSCRRCTFHPWRVVRFVISCIPILNLVLWGQQSVILIQYRLLRFHQVDSESLTVAVNFWWRSEMMSGMSEHMDSYYLRRLLKRLFSLLYVLLLRALSETNQKLIFIMHSMFHVYVKLLIFKTDWQRNGIYFSNIIFCLMWMMIVSTGDILSSFMI